jgi:Fe-S-cluster-containing dehydrogenase component/DMSO reductase anchor subunit
LSAAAGASVLPGVAPVERTVRRLPVLPVATLLLEQQSLTAVERFARRHDQLDDAARYRELVPLERPRPGEQYAFEVDLDACTGCKACVAACHNMNGLDGDELWRTVGLLHGGTEDRAVLQTVTTSCHHCLEPACLTGCPTQAYEKDSITGIVKHLDDQCFGCQYCTLMCPYDAPKYNSARGIVRKCDMCSDRLAHGEAPACVQACPNEAIAIRTVSRADVIESVDAHHFLPGAPAPDHTLPTTVYKSERPAPGNLLPADFHRTRPEHSHPPLVIMLTLTQLAAGAFVLRWALERLAGNSPGEPLAQAAFAGACAALALGASVFHLGRPLLAWRAFVGLRTSWLSREAVAFGIFAGLAMLHGAFVAAEHWPVLALPATAARFAPHLESVAALAGALGVFSSVMVYVATRREQWSGTRTGIKFLGTSIILGAASVFGVSVLTVPESSLGRVNGALLFLVLSSSLVKGAFEVAELTHAREARHSPLKRMACLMLGELRNVTLFRFCAGIVGGVLLPWAALSGTFASGSLRAPAAAMLVLLIAGELAERYLFFSAAPSSRMPGSLK